jgi:hypothetical protein
MKNLMAGLALGAIATLLLVPAPAARAQNEREYSTLTITEPVDVGSYTLQPGTYLTKVVVLSNGRHLVQVTNAEQTTIFASVLAVPHQILDDQKLPENRYVYYTTAPGQHLVLRTWFPRDTTDGEDITYPKRRAFELAAATKVPVVAVPDEVKESDYATTSLAVVTPERQVRPYEKPAPAVMLAEAVPPGLPATASQVPFFAMLGLLFVGGAVAIRVLGKDSPAV